MFEWLADPTAWLGLASLILLEIVLGIDNLIFIAILADKLPPHQRDRARRIGLGLALFMRLGLLASMSWLMTLTAPLFSVFEHAFSGRDLILLGGGLFLLFKGTMELHERLEGQVHEHRGPKLHASFAAVVTQIVILDAVFSLDAVITAVGMVEQLSVMMVAVIIAIGVMLVASKPLTTFVNKHPTVVILCLGFLMMIGFALVADGLGFHIPKGYLYAAIGFSILIEMLNQLARWNRMRFLSAGKPLRERTAEAVLRLLGGRPAVADGDDGALVAHPDEADPFQPAERHMIRSVLRLADMPIRGQMTPRPDVAWLDADTDADLLLAALEKHPYSRFLVSRGELDHLLGVIHSRDILAARLRGDALDLTAAVRQPLIVPGTMSSLHVLEQLRRHPVPMAVVVDEYGGVLGVVTTGDLLAAIAGELIDTEDPDQPLIVDEGGSWLLDGSIPLQQLEELLHVNIAREGYFTLAGLILHTMGDMPQAGSTFEWKGFQVEVVDIEGFRIDRVRVSPIGATQGRLA